MARQLAVLLASALVVAAAHAAETKPPSFGAWLRKQGQGAAKLAGYSDESDSYHGSYYGVETQQICMKDAWHKNCRGAQNGRIFHEFQSTEAVCCEADDYSHSKLDVQEPSIAMTCDVTSTLFYLDQIEVVARTTAKVGTATLTCTFKEPAEKCTGFSCDGVTITVDATVYDTTAYSHSPGYPLQLDDSCRSALDAKRAAVSTDKTAASELQTPAKAQYNSEYHEAKPIYKGVAFVYAGPITSVNGGKAHKWVGGWFEQVTDFWDPIKVDYVDNEHAPWIHPNSYNIELLESKAKY